MQNDSTNMQLPQQWNLINQQQWNSTAMELIPRELMLLALK